MSVQRLQALRAEMARRGLDAYLVPLADPHLSDGPPPCWQRLRFLCGFTGTAGKAVVTASKAGFWTDTRYHLQAEEELDPTLFTLFRSGRPEVPSPEEWIVQALKPGEIAGVDPRLLSCLEHERIERKLGEANIRLRAEEENLVDRLWPDRPALPRGKARLHGLEFSGEPAAKKLLRLRKEMVGRGAGALVLTLLEDSAWLFNLRGRDLPHLPVVIAYGIVTSREALLFMEEAALSGEERSALLGEGVAVRPYNDFAAMLDRLELDRGKVWIDPATCNHWVRKKLEDRVPLLLGPGPLPRFRAMKNDQEIEGLRAAHLRDGVALVRLLAWLERALPAGGQTEWSIACRLESFREEGDRYQGPSFSSIVAFQNHGAMMHYAPTAKRSAKVEGNGILLMDTGGQYLDGTTDVTRTVAVGEPTARQRRIYSQVLKALIGLSMQRFPAGTYGARLETVARAALWNGGIDFDHSVGHGIGSFLGVHEGHPALSYKKGKNSPLWPKMVSTIEPGCYLNGEFGVRIENVVCVRQDLEPRGEFPAFLKFEPLTLAPMDRKLIDWEILLPDERRWLADYHARILAEIGPYLDQKDLQWLK